MATDVSASISFHCHHHRRRRRHPFLSLPNHHHHHPPSLSLSAAHSPPPPPLRTGGFLTANELQKLDYLADYTYHQQLPSGLLWVRLMREEEMDMAAALLSESFAESMMMAAGYLKLLQFLVKNYLYERRVALPHSATLLGVYREDGEEDFELAGTVELTFDKKGANANPPTPTPPKNSPYICNMAVRKPLRRRGIGWHLLKAGEELITKMGPARDVYLHCRIIDEGPFNMYTKAGYSVVKTDSILTLLTLQRRRHLMRKELPPCENDSELNRPNEQLS